MKILKSLTALWRPNTQTVQGSIIGYDGDNLILLTLDGREVSVPLSAFSGKLEMHQVVTAKTKHVRLFQDNNSSS